MTTKSKPTVVWEPGVTLYEAYQRILRAAIKHHGNNQTLTAAHLGMSTKGLRMGLGIEKSNRKSEIVRVAKTYIAKEEG